VYFVYPETKGLMLEDMDILFGDQSVAPTPQLAAIIRSRGGSPAPTLEDFNHSIPSVSMRNGKPHLPGGGTGIVNWITGIFRKKDKERGRSRGLIYRPLDNEEF